MDFETLVPENTGGSGYTEVADFASLPSASSNTGVDILVQTSTGLWPINRHPAGIYRSNGTTWVWLGDVANEASEIAYTSGGGISATNVQDALSELDTEKLAIASAAAIAISGSGADLTANSVTLGKLAQLGASVLLGNNTGGSATPIALTPAQVKTLLAIAHGDVSGLGTAALINISVGTTAPTSPSVNDIWVDTN